MLVIYIIAILGLTIVLASLGRLLPTLIPDLKKTSPYECGFDPIKSARLPFSFRFFIVAILFLIFDLEIALLIATPFLATTSKGAARVTLLTIFLIILIVGL